MKNDEGLTLNSTFKVTRSELHTELELGGGHERSVYW